MSEKIVAFLGTGSMNGAIASGLLASGYDPQKIRATVRSRVSGQALAQKLGQDGLVILDQQSQPDANLDAVAGADVVLLGVKPYAILELVESLRGHLGEDTLLISVAAGVPLESLQQAAGARQPVIRCMPNTPSRLGKGVLAISSGSTVTAEHIGYAQEILGAVGEVVQVEEEQMDAVTALAGSGPAYAFLLAETMAAAGEKLGLDRATAQKLAAATVAGAGYLLDAEPDPEALRRAVTSPGGTTEQAIAAYCQGGLFELTQTAMDACAAKSADMSREYSK